MSKILFVMKYPLEEAYSVKGKFDGQMKAARSLGYDVYYIAYDHKATYLIHGEEKTCIKKIALILYMKNDMTSRNIKNWLA